MAINLDGFVTPADNFSGIYKAGDTLERRKYREDQANLQREGKKNAAGTFLNNYLDKKDFLTGTNYDPEIVRQLQETIQEGAKLAASGADTPTLMMALGPKVNRLNEYSTKAKLIDQSIKDSVGKLKTYKGYNQDTLSDEAKKLAFYDDKGQLKDISTIDPNQDWITEVVKLHPEKVTSGAGLDDFVAKTPMSEYSKEVQTMFGGRKKNVKYDAKAPFYMDIARDEKGGIQTDLNGNPVGLDVEGETAHDDKNQIMVNPETGEPYKVMAKASYNAIMQHNPDIADYVRGQVNQHFKQTGEKIPEEGTAHWDLMARSILRDELKTRDKSFFKTQDRETKSAPATRIELGYPAYAPKSSSGNSDTQLRNVYGKIDELIEKEGIDLPFGVGKSVGLTKGIPFNKIEANDQKIIIGLLGNDVDRASLAVIKTSDGKMKAVNKEDGELIAPLDFEGLNMAAQPGIKEKRKVIEETNKNKPEVKVEDLRKKYNY